MLWRGPMGGGAASGRIGAMVAGHCAQGQYSKSRVKPVNPNSTFQHPNRNSLRALAVQWGQLLTSTQRDSWATYAANVTWLNRLGDTVHLSGQMEFIRSNWLREHANLDPVLDAPTIFDRSSVGPAPTLSLSPGLTTGTLTMDVTAPWVDYSTQTALLLFVGIPRSGGITFMKRRTRRCAVVRASVMPLPNFTFTLPFTVPAFNQAWPAWVVATMADGRMTTPVPLTPVFTGPPPPPFWDEPFAYPDGPLDGNDGWVDSGSTGNAWQISVMAAESPAGPSGTAICTTPALQIFDLDQDWTFTSIVQRNLGTDLGNTLDLQLGGILPAPSGELYLIQYVFAAGDGALDQIDHFAVLDPSGGFQTLNGPFPFTIDVNHTLVVTKTTGQLVFNLDATDIGTLTFTPAPATFGFQMQWENTPGPSASILINSLHLQH